MDRDTLKEIFEEMDALTPAQLKAEISKHSHGRFAKIIMEMKYKIWKTKGGSIE